MASKKGVFWETLIGVVIVGLIIAFLLVPIFQGIISLMMPSPDYASVQGFERVWDSIQKVQEGKTVYVPLDIKSGYKITTGKFDSLCKNKCICLCQEDTPVKTSSGDIETKQGCSLKIFRQHCSRSEINMPQGKFASDLLREVNVVLFKVVKSAGGSVTITGDYSGSCLALDFDKCFSDYDSCFFRFRGSGITLGKMDQEVPHDCVGCVDYLLEGKGTVKDFLAAGTGFTKKKVDCERYSYYLDITTFATDEVETGFSIPLDYSHPITGANIEKIKKQCETEDPCKLKDKGITCKWEEDATAKTGTCKTATTTSP